MMWSSALPLRTLVSSTNQRAPPPPTSVAPFTDRIELAESRAKVEAATTLRDNLDVFTSGPSYPVFLKRVMPVFISILNGPCTFQSTSNEQVCESA